MELDKIMKVYEKTLEKRLLDFVKTDEKQFGFQLGKSLQLYMQYAGKVWSKEERAFPCLC